MSARDHGTARPGFLGVIVAVGLFALAGTAALVSVVIANAENQHTFRTLTDPGATSAQLDALTDQQVRNLRNAIPDQGALMTAFGSLGTPTLPSGGSTAQVAGNALEELTRNVLQPELIEYLSDPESSWNRDDGSERPADGTTPTGGVLPEEVPGGTGDVRLTLQWSASVDLDLHVIDPCGNEISFRQTTATCQGGTGSLDVDNTRGGAGSTENIFWPVGGAPTGQYQYWVHCYGGCGTTSASYTLTRTVDGRRVPTTGTLGSEGAESPRLTFSR